jgi:hypothetical protein
VYDPNPDTCCWKNCEAGLRNNGKPRVDWGYQNSDISECVTGPQGSTWKALGYCANPRLDIDNNLDQGIGLPENINLDQPRDGEGFRIMVENFTGTLAHPIVNIYCGGRRTATLGAPPDALTTFSGMSGSSSSLGAMWRVADVLVHVSENGSVSCTIEALHSETEGLSYNITENDWSF